MKLQCWTPVWDTQWEFSNQIRNKGEAIHMPKNREGLEEGEKEAKGKQF